MDSVMYDEVLKMTAFPHNIRIGLKNKTGNPTDFHDIAQQQKKKDAWYICDVIHIREYFREHLVLLMLFVHFL